MREENTLTLLHNVLIRSGFNVGFALGAIGGEKRSLIMWILSPPFYDLEVSPARLVIDFPFGLLKPP